MAHINSMGVALYTDLAIAIGTSIVPATMDDTGFKALFATADTGTLDDAAIAGGFVRILNVREFPAMGTPPNIIKVPVFGSKQSQQIQGQADAPSLEITLNYVPSDWSPNADPVRGLSKFVNDGITRAFRFSLMNSDSAGVTAATKYASLPLGLGTVQNSVYYWTGRMEALLVKPSLTDATTATLTLSMQSDFYGAYTY
jgi:hypothetical protein